MMILSQFLNEELRTRSIALNDKVINEDADYVLVWLQQTLRGEDHPTIDAAVSIGNALGLPVLVYHGLRQDYPHASARLHSFIIGASREMAITLAARGIRCVQHISRGGNFEKGLVYRLAEKAAAVLVDRHATFVAQVQSESFASKSDIATIAVDATRLVPHAALPKSLHATKDFRTAHSPLRDHYLNARVEIQPIIAPYDGALCFTPDMLIDMDDAQIGALVAQCDIDHSLPISSDFPATKSALDARLQSLCNTVIGGYKAKRNNPAAQDSSSGLSPYLHFGMTSPFAILRALNAAQISDSVRYKFTDELLTWREWTHWRMSERPNFVRYESLPSSARKTLELHASDDREMLLSYDDLTHGNTPDETWNAAQRQWLKTGWMHNNLRMYWAKQLLRWTASPQDAWAMCCALNDRLSLDGRDPATYVSMRWAFGEARPAYHESPIYGWVAPKNDDPLRKRSGTAKWLEYMANLPVPRIDCSNWETVREYYI